MSLICTSLHCTALHCTALHCTALHCTALHCTALHRSTAPHCTALHCTVMCTCRMHLSCSNHISNNQVSVRNGISISTPSFLLSAPLLFPPTLSQSRAKNLEENQKNLERKIRKSWVTRHLWNPVLLTLPSSYLYLAIT